MKNYIVLCISKGSENPFKNIEVNKLGQTTTLEEAYELMKKDFKEYFLEKFSVLRDDYTDLFEGVYPLLAGEEYELLERSAWMNSYLDFDIVWNIIDIDV